MTQKEINQRTAAITAACVELLRDDLRRKVTNRIRYGINREANRVARADAPPIINIVVGAYFADFIVEVTTNSKRIAESYPKARLRFTRDAAHCTFIVIDL